MGTKQDRKVINIEKSLFEFIDEIMRDEDFPFNNFTLFLALGSWELVDKFKKIKHDKNELIKFRTKLLEDAKTMGKKELIHKKLYKWKVEEEVSKN